MNDIQSVLVIFSLAMTGCTHTLMRGTVALKASEQKAYVCLGDNEVRVGQRLAFFKSDCHPPIEPRPQDAPTSPCVKRKIGEGVVTQLINEHYSEVKLDQNVKVDEGTAVETF